MRICVISEDLAIPLDEGVKKFSYSLMKALSTEHQVMGMSRKGVTEDVTRVEEVPMNKLLLNFSLWRKIRRFSPQVICYIPFSSGTFYSFIRARILKWHGGGARVIMISLQPRRFSSLKAKCISWLCPDAVVVQSRESARYLEKLGCVIHIFPSGIEVETFTPVSEAHKQELRDRYGLPKEVFILLHVGHINSSRGVALFKEIQMEPGVQVLLVASTSTPQDEHLAAALEKAGVRIWRHYLPRIHEIYQLADCYIFPVSAPTAAIELPLSVLEAMACNLPVVSTRYGALGDLFQPGDGLLFAATPEEFHKAISLVKKGLPIRTRTMVESFAWEKVVRDHWRSLLS